MRDEEYNGELLVIIIFIDNIWRFYRNWFNIFLEVFCKYDYKDIVKVIDFLFLESEYFYFLGFIFLGGFYNKYFWK